MNTNEYAIASLQVVAAQTAILDALMFISEGVGDKAEAIAALNEAFENLSTVLKCLEGLKP